MNYFQISFEDIQNITITLQKNKSIELFKYITYNKHNKDTDEKQGVTKEGIIEPKEYPVAYDFKLVNAIILETDVDEMIVFARETGKGYKLKIVPCANIFDLNINGEYDRVENKTGMNIKYSKAVIDENGYFFGLVYFEDIDKWNFLNSNTYHHEGVLTDKYYSIETINFYDRIELSQEEIDNILQSVTETSE